MGVPLRVDEVYPVEQRRKASVCFRDCRTTVAVLLVVLEILRLEGLVRVCFETSVDCQRRGFECSRAVAVARNHL